MSEPRVWRAVGFLGSVLLVGCPQSSRPAEKGVSVKHVPRAEVRSLSGPAVEHTLGFSDRRTHYVDVESIFPTDGAPSLELFMAVWTPGSYLVREYAKHIESVSAATLAGEPLSIRKTRKNRFTVDTGGEPRVVVRYRLYARDMSVRTNFVDADLAVLNGAAVFLCPVERLSLPHDIKLEVPGEWSVVTALDPHSEGGRERFMAADYDELVDSPIVLGTAQTYEFAVAEVPHVLANFEEGGIWDGPRSAEDAKRIVEEQARFWGVLPYDRYVFLNVLSGKGGGLEHKRSSLLMTSPFDSRQRDPYLTWLGMVSHEFFHTWNIKQLRPKSLGPFDYENEVYTRSLWVAEGITSYYDDLFLRRASLIDQEEYLETLSKQIEDVETTPGRLVQPLESSSYDTWIKFYRPDENSSNSAISYYRKGAVVAFLLDAHIRRTSRGTRSLDEVMRLAYARYSGPTGFTPEEFQRVAEEVVEAPLEDFFSRYVRGTDELDYSEALDYFGLRFPVPKDDEGPRGTAHGGREDDEDRKAWLGVTTEDGSRITVKDVRRGEPAYAAGINVDDEILAIGEYRVNDLREHLQNYEPGDTVSVLVARRGKLRRIDVTLGTAPEERHALEVLPAASGAQRARLHAWLGLDLGTARHGGSARADDVAPAPR